MINELRNLFVFLVFANHFTVHNGEVSRGGFVAVVVGISDRWQVLFFDKKSQKAKKC